MKQAFLKFKNRKNIQSAKDIREGLGTFMTCVKIHHLKQYAKIAILFDSEKDIATFIQHEVNSRSQYDEYDLGLRLHYATLKPHESEKAILYWDDSILRVTDQSDCDIQDMIRSKKTIYTLDEYNQAHPLKEVVDKMYQVYDILSEFVTTGEGLSYEIPLITAHAEIIDFLIKCENMSNDPSLISLFLNLPNERQVEFFEPFTKLFDILTASNRQDSGDIESTSEQLENLLGWSSTKVHKIEAPKTMQPIQIETVDQMLKNDLGIKS